MFKQSLIHLALSGLMYSSSLVAASTSSEYFENALKYHYEDNNESAVIELKNALKQDYNNFSARILLGQIYLKNGEVAAAAKEFKIVLAGGVDKNLIQLDYGSALYGLRQYQQIISEIRPTRNDLQTDADIHILRGSAYLKLNQMNEAKAEFNQALSLIPGYIKAKLALAGMKMQNNAFKEAKAELEAILNTQDNANAWFMLAEISKKQSRFQTALKQYQQALILDKDNISARHALIELAFKTEDLAQAETQIELLELDWGDDPLTGYYRALLALQKGDKTKAEAILNKLISTISGLEVPTAEQSYTLNMISAASAYLLSQSETARTQINALLLRSPNNLTLALMLADIELKEGNYYTVQSLLDKWLDQPVKNVRFYLILANAYANQRGYRQAQKVIARGLNIYPDNLELIQLMASIHAALGENEKALTLLESALPELNNKAKLKYGYILLEQGKVKQALRQAEALNENASADAATRNFYAACLMQSGNQQKAKDILNNILKQNRNYIPGLLNLSRIQIKQQNYRAAVKTLESILSLDSTAMSAVYMLADLYLLDSDVESANTVLAKALTESTEQPGLLKKLININLAAQNYALVEQYTRRLNQAEPLSAFVIEARVKLNIAQNQIKLARRNIGSLYGLSLNNPEKLETISTYQLAIKDLQGLERTVNHWENIQPNNTNVGLVKAKLLYLKQGKEKAFAQLEKVKNTTPAIPWLETHKYIYLAENDYAGALNIVEKQLQVISLDSLLKQRIALLNKLGKTQKAIEFVNLIIKDNPDLTDYQTIKTDLLLGSGKQEEALDELENLLENNPNDAKVLNNLAAMLAYTDPQKALNYIQKAYELMPEKPQVLDTYGLVLIQLKQPEKALTYLRQAYLKAPRQLDVNYHLAQALLDLKRDTEAKGYLLKAESYAKTDADKQKVAQLEHLLAN